MRAWRGMQERRTYMCLLHVLVVAHVDQTIVSICYQYCLYRCFSVL